MNGNIVEKIEVRRKLNAYKSVIRDRIKEIVDEKERMENACTTEEMKKIYLTSKEYMVLKAKHETLGDIVNDIYDLLDEFEEDEI